MLLRPRSLGKRQKVDGGEMQLTLANLTILQLTLAKKKATGEIQALKKDVVDQAQVICSLEGNRATSAQLNKRKIDELDALVVSEKRKTMGVELTIEALELTVKEMTQEAGEKDMYNKQLADGNKELADNNKELEDKIKELVGNKKDLVDHNKELADNNKELEDKIKELVGNNMELVDHNKELEDKIKESADKNKVLMDKIKELEDKEASIVYTTCYPVDVKHE